MAAFLKLSVQPSKEKKAPGCFHVFWLSPAIHYHFTLLFRLYLCLVLVFFVVLFN